MAREPTPGPRNRRGAAGPRTSPPPTQSSGSNAFGVFVAVVLIFAVIAVCVLVVVSMTSGGAGLQSFLLPPPTPRPAHVFAYGVIPATDHVRSSAAPSTGDRTLAAAHEHSALARCRGTVPADRGRARMLVREIQTMGSLDLPSMETERPG